MVLYNGTSWAVSNYCLGAYTVNTTVSYIHFINVHYMLQPILVTITWKIKVIMLYVFFWVIPWRLNFICRCFGTLRLFHLHRQIDVHLPAYEDGTDRVF
jgi:hypothetical protein